MNTNVDDGNSLWQMGFLAMGLSPVIGYFLGDHQRVAGAFNWAVASLAFAPFFVGGSVLVVGGFIVGAIERSTARHRASDSDETD